MEEKENKEKTNRRDVQFPHISLDEAINVAKKIHGLGGFASKQELGSALKRKGGWLGVCIVSTKRYGLIEGHGRLELTELAKKIISPTYEGEASDAKKEAFLGIKLFSEINSRFKGKYPEENLFANILMRNYGVKNRKEATKLMNIIKKGTEVLLPPSSEEIREEESEGEDLRKEKSGGQEGFTKKDISIIVKAPGINHPFYAKDKKEFEKIIKDKLPIAIESVRNSLKLLDLEDTIIESKGEKEDEAP